MLLDYVPSTEAYTLRVLRSEGHNIAEFMADHGLDMSAPKTTADSALFFTREPYAAVSFREHATPQARARLAPLIGEIDASWRAESSAHIACPADCELWGFQKADVEYALRRTNTLVGDQPGLGKTPVAICYANEIRAKRVLVICPANIRLQWCKRIREWTTMRWPYNVYPILHGRHGVHPSAEWTIVSYDLARTEGIGKALARGTYDLVILDEAHYLKSTDSARSQVVFGDLETGMFNKVRRSERDEILGYDEVCEPLAKRCGAIMALTGTPMPNRPREAYMLARHMNWDAIDWLSEANFKERFNPSMKREEIDAKTGRVKIWTDERTGRHAELQNRLRANFMVRHMKRDVMPQLKMPYLDIVYVEETGAVKQALQAESLLDIDPDTFKMRETEDKKDMGVYAIVRRQMGMAVAPLAAEYVSMVLDGGEEKVVVFGWHIAVLDLLQERLAKYGVIRIDGSTSAKQKQDRVERFASDRSYRVCLGNLKSLGTGTDGLQAVATHAIFAEYSEVPGDNEQAIDRLDRGGQLGTVQADFLVAPGSLGEKIMASSLRKKQTTNSALDRRY